MRWVGAGRPHVFQSFHDARSKKLRPDPIDHRSTGEWMLFMAHPIGERDTIRDLGRRDVAQRSWNAGRDAFTQRRSIASKMHVGIAGGR